MGAVGALVVATLGARARRHGEDVYEYRRGLAMAMAPRPSGAPRIVWLGDSTLYQEPNYLARVGAALPAFQQVSVAIPGLDPFSYFCLIDRTLMLRPRLVVMIANLRLLRPDPRHADLVSM